MAEERNTENFALGLIVAAIIWFLFHKKIESALGMRGGSRGGAGGSNGGGRNSGGSHTSSGGCGCGCGGGNDLPQNPGVSIGGQSYQSPVAAFGSSSVTPVPRGAFFESAPSRTSRTDLSISAG